MLKFKGISEHLIRTTLNGMARRLFTSVITFPIMYWMVAVHSGNFDLQKNRLQQISVMMLVVGGLIRIYLVKYSTKILAKENGEIHFRLLFLAMAAATSLVWSITFVDSWLNFGVQTNTLIIFTICMSIQNSALSAWGFDLLALMMMNILTVMPMIAAVILRSDLSGSTTLAVMLGMWFLYALYFARSAHKNQWTLLEYVEAIAARDRQLESAFTKLNENHSLIQTMFESLDEAFLIFDENGVCSSSPSKRSQLLLGFDPLQKHIGEIVEPRPEKRDNIAAWYSIFFMDKLDFSDLASQGIPVLKANEGKTILKVGYHPMRNADEKLTGVVMTATDVTDEFKAKGRAEQANEKSEMILRILENKTAFGAYLIGLEKMLDSCTFWDGENLAELQRGLHTYKGSSLMFGVTTLGKAIHDLEISIRENLMLDPVAAVRTGAATLKIQFDEWYKQEFGLFTKLGVFEHSSINISMRRLIELKTEFVQGQNKKTADVVERIFEVLSNTELGDLLRDFELHAQTTAAKLQKQVVFTLERFSEPIYITLSDYRDTLRAFVHLINNSIDHGLETPTQRLAAGKKIAGKLIIRYGRETIGAKRWLKVLIEDDGRGINVVKIREKLERKGQHEDAKKSDLEVAMQIFEDGVSTAENVTEISGQGVGMGAVRAAIQKVRGKIQIVRTGPFGTTFEILLPDTTAESAKTVLEPFRAS